MCDWCIATRVLVITAYMPKTQFVCHPEIQLHIVLQLIMVYTDIKEQLSNRKFIYVSIISHRWVYIHREQLIEPYSSNLLP